MSTLEALNRKSRKTQARAEAAEVKAAAKARAEAAEAAEAKEAEEAEEAAEAAKARAKARAEAAEAEAAKALALAKARAEGAEAAKARAEAAEAEAAKARAEAAEAAEGKEAEEAAEAEAAKSTLPWAGLTEAAEAAHRRAASAVSAAERRLHLLSLGIVLLVPVVLVVGFLVNLLHVFALVAGLTGVLLTGKLVYDVFYAFWSTAARMHCAARLSIVLGLTFVLCVCGGQYWEWAVTGTLVWLAGEQLLGPAAQVELIHLKYEMPPPRDGR